MPKTILKRTLINFILAAIFLPDSIIAIPDASISTSDLNDLRDSIASILEATNTPGAGIALVTEDKIIWTGGVGMVDLELVRPANSATIFYQGSISKSLVTIAVMMLVEQGLFSLDDPLHVLIPEISIENRWAEQEPLRLVHLLEHTAGLDDIHLSEYAYGIDNHYMPLKAGLNLFPNSRTVRWPPGRFFSYSNNGHWIAAYIVEKYSGQSYGEFVSSRILKPLNMKTATYFRPPELDSLITMIYADDGITETKYQQILPWPVGSFIASPADMANFIQFFLKRGKFEDQVLLSSESIDRLEIPTTSLAAQQGIRTGYGPGNYTLSLTGMMFHGHAGAGPGYRAEYGYCPETGVGYALMINKRDPSAARNISILLRNFLTRDVDPRYPKEYSVDADELNQYVGYYQHFTPRNEMFRFAGRLYEVLQVELRDGYLHVGPVFGDRARLMPVRLDAFRGEWEPDASLVFHEDREYGTVLEALSWGGPIVAGNYRKVPAFSIWTQWLGLVLVAPLIMLVYGVYALYLLVNQIRVKALNSFDFVTRILPSIAAICLALIPAIVFLSGERVEIYFGAPTFWAWSVFFLSIAFAAITLVGLLLLLPRARSEIGKFNWWFTMTAYLANAAMLIYLHSYGWIGMKTWLA